MLILVLSVARPLSRAHRPDLILAGVSARFGQHPPRPGRPSLAVVPRRPPRSGRHRILPRLAADAHLVGRRR
jgi:hypothetical protein